MKSMKCLGAQLDSSDEATIVEHFFIANLSSVSSSWLA